MKALGVSCVPLFLHLVYRLFLIMFARTVGYIENIAQRYKGLHAR